MWILTETVQLLLWELMHFSSKKSLAAQGYLQRETSGGGIAAGHISVSIRRLLCCLLFAIKTMAKLIDTHH